MANFSVNFIVYRQSPESACALLIRNSLAKKSLFYTIMTTASVVIKAIDVAAKFCKIAGHCTI